MSVERRAGSELDDLMTHCEGCERFLSEPKSGLPLAGHCSAAGSDDCPVFWHGCCTTCGSLEVFKLQELADKQFCICCGRSRLFEAVGTPNGSPVPERKKPAFVSK